MVSSLAPEAAVSQLKHCMPLGKQPWPSLVARATLATLSLSCRSSTRSIGRTGIHGLMLRHYLLFHIVKTRNWSMAMRWRALGEHPQLCWPNLSMTNSILHSSLKHSPGLLVQVRLPPHHLTAPLLSRCCASFRTLRL